MRKHPRKSYKGRKFRKRDPQANYYFYTEWLRDIFLPEYLYRGAGRWSYIRIRKIYNAWYKKLKTEHKKKGGWVIGDTFWMRCKDNEQTK